MDHSAQVNEMFPRGVHESGSADVASDPLNKILYPREYVINYEDPDLSYVRGRTYLGNDVAVYLRVSQKDREAINEDSGKTVPALSDFAEKRPNARRKCFASDTNSPESPSGVLLIEQVESMSEPPHQHQENESVLCAKWMSILQEQDYNPASFGAGYLDVTFLPVSPKYNPEMAKMISNYKRLYGLFGQALSDRDFTGLEPQAERELNTFRDVSGRDVDSSNLFFAVSEMMDYYQREIIQERKKVLSVSLIQPHETIKMNLGGDLYGSRKDQITQFREALREPLERHTKEGCYGGAIIRLRRGNTVSSNVFDVVNMRYDSRSNGPRSFDEVFKEFLKFGNKDLVNAIGKPKQNQPGGTDLEIIPCRRINFGPKSYPRYEEDLLKLSDSKIFKTYISEQDHRLVGIEDLNKRGSYLYSMMAIRHAEAVGKGRGNILASAFHSFSAPLSSVLQVNRENSRLVLSGKPTPSSEQQRPQPAESPAP